MRTTHILVLLWGCVASLACNPSSDERHAPNTTANTPPPTPPHGAPTMADLDRAEGELARTASFDETDLARIRAAAAEHNLGRLRTGCNLVPPVVPAALQAETTRLCQLDAPRLFLEHALALAKVPGEKLQGQNIDAAPGCLHASGDATDAFHVLSKHPATDPALTKLVDELVSLCPKMTSSLRAQFATP